MKHPFLPPIMDYDKCIGEGASRTFYSTDASMKRYAVQVAEPYVQDARRYRLFLDAASAHIHGKECTARRLATTNALQALHDHASPEEFTAALDAVLEQYGDPE